MSDARQAILARLSQAPRLRLPGRTPLPDIPQNADWLQMGEELGAVRASFDLALGKDQARDVVLRILREHGVDSAVRWEHPQLERIGLDALLADAGVRMEEAGCLRSSGAGIGITAAHAAIVETGTIIVRAGIGCERSTSLLPPVHLALVHRDALLPRLDDLPGLLDSWHNDGLPSAVHLITGPSCTADIELVKVYGVHGPMALHVLGIDF